MISEAITELPIETVLSVSALDRINVLSISDLQSIDENKNHPSTHTSCSSSLCSPSPLSSPTSPSASPSVVSSSTSSLSSPPNVEQPSNEDKRNEGKKASEISLLPRHYKVDVYSMGNGSNPLSPSQLPIFSKKENEKVSDDRSRSTPPSLSFSLSPAPPPRRILNPYDGPSDTSKSGLDQDGGAHMMLMYKRGGLGGDREEKGAPSSSFPSNVNLFRRQSFNGKARLLLNYQSPPAVLTAHSNSMNLVSKTTQDVSPSSSANQPSSSFPSILTAGDLQLTPTHVAFSGHANRLKITARNRFSTGISRQVQSTQIQSIRSLHADADDQRKSEITSRHLPIQNLAEFHPSSSPSTQGNLSDWRRVAANPIIRGRWVRLIRKVLMKGKPLPRPQEPPLSLLPHPSPSLSPSSSHPIHPPGSLHHTMTREKLRPPPSILQRLCPGCTPHGTPDVLRKRQQHIRARLLNSNPSDSKNQSYLLIEVSMNKGERKNLRERKEKDGVRGGGARGGIYLW